MRKTFEQFTPDESDNSDDFEAVDADIEVRYSTGTCDEDEGEIWNVAKGKAVSIKISPNSEYKLADFGFDLSSFAKEQRMMDAEDGFIFYDKSKGIAILANDDVVEEIILFPPISSKAKACKHKEAKEFISHTGWFGSKKLEDRKVPYCPVVSVTKLVLSQETVMATGTRQIEVSTTAQNPLNDVISYIYTVSGGKIVGKGAKVTWDLTGVPAGSYLITAGVDDGAGILGQTRSASVTVK